ncbi:MAG: response regulator [Isosphaeraceae bacterium]
MDRPFSLLLVEDESILRGLVAQFLRREGYHIVEAEDGVAGLDLFENYGPFDVVVTDLMMPRMGGLQLCGEIRAIAADQPIVVCSAAFSPQPEQILLDLGIDGFLRKPYHPEALLSRLRRELGGRRRDEPAPARKVG